MPGHGRRHHAHPGGAHLRFVEVVKLGLHLVEKVQIAGLHGHVVVQTEAQQHGLFQPLVRHPLAAHALGHPQFAHVELVDHMADRLAQFRRCIGRAVFGAVFPGLVDKGLQLLRHGEGLCEWIGSEQ
jgi:hypothetical protein